MQTYVSSTGCTSPGHVVPVGLGGVIKAVTSPVDFFSSKPPSVLCVIDNKFFRDRDDTEEGSGVWVNGGRGSPDGVDLLSCEC